MFQKPKRAIDRVFIHCSAASRTSVTAAEIDRWHKDRGWNGIGYHYFIRTDGTLEAGRDLEHTPAAQRGHNRHTIAICLNGLEVSDFTEAQFATLQKLCSEINQACDGVTFHGHREVSPKSCPVFDYKRVLGLDAAGKMTSRTVDPVIAAPTQSAMADAEEMLHAALSLQSEATAKIRHALSILNTNQESHHA